MFNKGLIVDLLLYLAMAVAAIAAIFCGAAIILGPGLYVISHGMSAVWLAAALVWGAIMLMFLYFVNEAT